MEPNNVKKEPSLIEDPSLVSLEARLQREAAEEYGSLPWVRDKPADFKPQRVFLSYGHPELAICQDIYMALKARGHDPWFDKISLRVGRDWRGAIAEGVQNSQTVIACLSEHSTREGEDGRSVCLDELAIAVGAKEGRIRTVLLGPESTVRPPDLVSHIQWLDMSDWEEKLHAGADVFMPWFATCMRELFRLIESPESLEFAGQIHALKAILQPACDSSQRRQAELLKNGVVGREWLVRQVNDWLDDENDCPVCLLHGRPGVGKSAFSAYYTHYDHRVAAAVFCVSNQPSFNNPRQVLRTLAYLLACRLPDYRLALLRMLTADFETIVTLQGKALQKAAESVRVQLAAKSESELFDMLFRNVLPQTIDGGRPNMVILIDGLDECGGQEGNALAQVLSECFCYRPGVLWPRWLKVLVVARKTQEVTQWLPDAGAGGAVRWLSLNEAGEENLADIRTYFVQQLADLFGQAPAWPQALAVLTERSGGYFLYAELLTDFLKKRRSLADIDSYPVGLDNAFLLWFARTFPDIKVYQNKFQDALGALAAAPAPLPETVLQDLFDWGDTALAQFIAPLEPLLRHGRDEFGDRTLAFYHPYVGEWLTEAHKTKPPYHRYFYSREDALQMLTGRFFRVVQVEAQTPANYVLLWLPLLLRQSPETDRRGVRAALYKKLVQTDDWFEQRLQIGLNMKAALPAARNQRVQILQECRSIAEDAFSVNPWIGWRWAMARADMAVADTVRLDNAEQAFSLYQRALETVESTPGIMESGRVTVQVFIATACSSMAHTLGNEDSKKATKALALADWALAIWETLIEQDVSYERSWLSTCETVCRLLSWEAPRRKQLSERGLALALKYYSESDRFGDTLTIFIFEGFLSESLSAMQAAGGELYGELQALGLYKQSMTKWLAEYSKEKKGAWHWLFSCENVCRLLLTEDPRRELLCEQALAAINSPDSDLDEEDRQGYRRAFEALSRGEGGPIWPVLV